MFDKKVLKENLMLIVGLVLMVIVLAVLNIFISSPDDSTTKLDNGDIDVNKLVINEVMTSNKGAYSDEYGNTYDWIELYNGSDKDIDLSKYTLSDEESGNAKWIFPKYSCDYSNHIYNQPQLFTILAMKTYLKTTYREIMECLELMDKIRKFLGLNKLPHFTTIHILMDA